MIKVKLYKSKYGVIFYGVVVVLFAVLLWMIAKPYFGVRYNYAIGDISGEDIITPKDITYINVKETIKRKEEVKHRVPVIFDLMMSIEKELLKDLNSFYDVVADVNISDQSLEDKVKEIQKGKYAEFEETLIVDILTNYEEMQYREKIERAITHILKGGLSSYKKEELLKYKNNGIILKRIHETEITHEKIEVDQITAEDEQDEAVTKYFTDNFSDMDSQSVSMLVKQSHYFLIPNLFYNTEESKRLMDEEVRKVEPFLNTIKKGAIIIRRGEEIDDINFPKLEAITVYTSRFNLNAIIGIGIVLLLLIYISIILFRGEETKVNIKKYSVFAGFALFTVFYAYLITLINTRPHYLTFGVLVPIAGITMTVEVLYERKFSLTLAMTLPIFLLLISGNDPFTFLFLVGSGLVAIYAVKDAEKRNDLLKASIFIIFTNEMLLTAIGLLRELAWRQIFTLLIWGAGNGIVSIIFSLGVIPFFEVILNLPTNFRLLELSDLNTPILKKMQIEAPGSYNHSLNVANMTESAAKLIRANPLLVRVAALYHDIGKIPNSEYFIENNPGESKHDFIKPSLSNSILKAHVKIGVEMAKEMKLPAKVIDIITQHHGTSLMKYFYHQALKKKDKDLEVPKQDYHYQGPKPQTREAAIVMLADAVEAASRLLKNPSTKRIEEFVTEIIESKFRERQLNESSLTLRGLMKISIAFRRYLTGVFHSRIEYPDDKEIDETKRRETKDTG